MQELEPSLCFDHRGKRQTASLVRAAAAAVAAAAKPLSHPWNPRSQVVEADLAGLAGLARAGVNLCRLPAGQESFVEHAHQLQEEWAYVLSGRAVALIDGVEHEVGPGDFMGFPTPSVAHHLKNPFDVECVYLAGGENLRAEVVDFPGLGRRTVRIGENRTAYDLASGEPFGY